MSVVQQSERNIGSAMGLKVERLVEELAFRIKRSAKDLDLSRASRSRHQPIREPRKSESQKSRQSPGALWRLEKLT